MPIDIDNKQFGYSMLTLGQISASLRNGSDLRFSSASTKSAVCAVQHIDLLTRLVLALPEIPMSIENSRISPDHDLILSPGPDINIMLDGYTGDILDKALYKNSKSALGQCVNICAYIPCWEYQFMSLGSGLTPLNPTQARFLNMKRDIDSVLGDAYNTHVASLGVREMVNLWV